MGKAQSFVKDSLDSQQIGQELWQVFAVPSERDFRFHSPQYIDSPYVFQFGYIREHLTTKCQLRALVRSRLEHQVTVCQQGKMLLFTSPHVHVHVCIFGYHVYMIIRSYIHVYTISSSFAFWPFFQLAVQCISITFQHLAVINLVAKTVPLDHGLTLVMTCAYTCTCVYMIPA